MLKSIQIVKLDEIRVARVKSEKGTLGAEEAFNRLESKMKSLRGRKMYGVVYPDSGDYYACVKLDEKNSDDMGFETGNIPGGKYAKRKIMNWTKKINEISKEFESLIEDCRKSYEIDKKRPNIEYYRSFKELRIMVPVN